MATLSARAVASDRRSDDRTRIARTAVLRLDGTSHGIRVEDLTRDGCKITTDVELEIGQTVTLGFAGVGRTQAEVIWCDAESYGCIFEEPLPPGAVTAATRNNVDHFAGPEAMVEPLSASDVKWSPRSQMLIILGAASLLWLALIAGAVLIS